MLKLQIPLHEPADASVVDIVPVVTASSLNEAVTPLTTSSPVTVESATTNFVFG